jgi:hypothetical protein
MAIGWAMGWAMDGGGVGLYLKRTCLGGLVWQNIVVVVHGCVHQHVVENLGRSVLIRIVTLRDGGCVATVQNGIPCG